MFTAGRKASSYAGSSIQPYVLKAISQFAGKNGVEAASYEDVWLSQNQWRREAKAGSSVVARARKGDIYYRDEKGDDVGILRLILTAVEPIPSDDTMTESDWRVRRETLRDIPVIRVIRGPEFADAAHPSGSAQAFWFAADGRLLQTYTSGLTITPAQFTLFSGKMLPRVFAVSKDAKTGLKISVESIEAPTASTSDYIPSNSHEWKRAFTAETR